MAYEVVGSTTLPNPDNNSSFNSPSTINNAGIVGGSFLTQPPGYPELEVGYNLSPAGDFSSPSHPGWNIAIVGTTNNGVSFGTAEGIDGLGNSTTNAFGFIDNNGTFTALPSGLTGPS
jgi:hypothetical protein